MIVLILEVANPVLMFIKFPGIPISIIFSGTKKMTPEWVYGLSGLQ